MDHYCTVRDTWLTRNSLCELRMKDGTREVFAILAYESGK
ncbi:Hok/Gef family protein [Escherichia coli]